MVDPTVVVGVAGIAGTLAKGILGPWATDVLSRSSDRRGRRTDLYVEVPAQGQAMHEPIDRVRSHHTETVGGLADEEMRYLSAKLTAIGSQRVNDAFVQVTVAWAAATPNYEDALVHVNDEDGALLPMTEGDPLAAEALGHNRDQLWGISHHLREATMPLGQEVRRELNR